MLKIGTDFSGIGAPEQALKNLGINFKSVFACEIDKHARKSFEAVHGKPETFYNDITKRDHSEVEQLDIYIAGFPCQSFSMAGKRKGFEEARGTLFFNVAEFIKINQPKCFILENVKGLVSHDNGKTLQTILSLLSDNGGTINKQIFIPYFLDGLGYHVYYKVLNTKNYGIPQNRERIFIVGFKDFRDFNFPKEEQLKTYLKDLLQNEIDEKYFLSEKLLKHFINKKNKGFQFKPINENSEISYFIPATYHKMAITNTFIETNLKNKNIDIEWIADYRHDDGIRIRKDKIAPCLKASQNGRSLSTMNIIKIKSANKKGYEEASDADNINKTIRRLTPLECWRLQNFPDDAFYRAQKVNSDTQLYKQAGNSITVAVIEKIIKNVLNL